MKRHASATVNYSPEKLSELVLYIAERSAFDSAFGMTKLYKILYFSDFWAHAKFGQPITGATYVKLDHGPVPHEASQRIADLEEQQDVCVVESDFYGRKQRRVVPTRSANLSLFTAQEIALVDRVLSGLKDQNATQVSQLSHEMEMGWRVARYREGIPYHTVFLSAEPLTDSEIVRAQELARENGWVA